MEKLADRRAGIAEETNGRMREYLWRFIRERPVKYALRSLRVELL